MKTMSVYILDKDATIGEWLRGHLRQIGVEAHWVSTVHDLIAAAEEAAPALCLLSLRPPVAQVLALITELSQEPRFAQTSFIVMGPVQYKRAAFETGADDYLTTPPDVIELRKRVRLYLDRAVLQARVMAETALTQEMEALAALMSDSRQSIDDTVELEPVTVLEHAAALTRERNLFDLVLRHAGVAISLVDPVGKLVYVNPTWERIVGAALEQRVGDVLTWPPVTDNLATNQAIASAIQNRLAWQGEFRHVRPSKRPVEVIMSLAPAYDANGELEGFVVTEADAGERRLVEQLKSRFLSDASFEMRTPVTNIKMRQYLLDQAPPEQHGMHLQALQRETERLSNLVEAMLELSRLDAGLTPMHFAPADLVRMVKEAVIRYGPTAEEKGVTLGLSNVEVVPAVEIDAGHMARAIGIIIENAIHYTPEGGHVAVRVRREAWTGGGFACIEVQDTGIGIAAEALPQIFERFFRSDRARDSGLRGVGLGLALAQEIVVRHNGNITAESEVNQGSTFTIWLPIARPTSAADGE